MDETNCLSLYMNRYDPEFNYIDLLDEIWYDPRKPDLKGANSQALSKTKLTFEEKNRACFILIITHNLAKQKEEKQKNDLKSFTEAVNGLPSRIWFVTVNFKSDIKISDFKKWIERFLNKSIVLSLKGVFEIHKKTAGLHPHFHMVIEMNYKKSKVIQYISESAFLKKLLKADNYIDVKEFKDYHLDYISGKKKDDKMEFVEKDREFRKNNDIPQIYVKHKN